MRIQPISVFALVALTACDGPQVEFRGTKMQQLFPFDGLRTWEYISTDESVPHKLVGRMRSMEPEVMEGMNVYTVDYTKFCLANDPGCVDGDPVRTVKWASDEIKGVYIMEWSEGGGSAVTFEPPLMFADVEMKRDDTIETETGGAVWRLALDGFEECPVRMQVDWPECARLSLTADGGTGGQGLAGQYWAARGQNLVAMQIEGEGGTWELSKVTCEEDCDGNW